jgi:squalene cyclase
MLAISKIAPNYEIKAGTTSRTLAHLIATEKRNCSRGQNQALTLAGLSFYTPPDEHWRNVLGEDWSLERLVFEELSRRADQSSSDVTNQLLGLSAAVQRYQLDKRPLTGSLASAVTHIQTYQQFALSVQNHDGTWHPNFFVSKGSSPDSDGVLYATAHIMRALVYSLPPERLSDAQIQRGLTALASQLSQRGSAYSQWSEKQLEGTTVGLHALAIYYQKTFGRSAIQKAE